MGVLNVTPDSFSDGGEHLAVERAVEHARRMMDEGAAYVDVGGESTRPGADPVDPVEECRRIIPVVEALAPIAREARVRLSVDTRNEATARAAVRHGVTLINDVSASLWPVAAELGVGWVAMHMAGDPRTMQRSPRYDDVVAEVGAFLDDRAARAAAAGVREIWIDPGIGFGKTTEHNLELLAHLDALAASGLPVLVGTSRKRFLGELLADASGEPAGVEDRLEGSVATAVWSALHGASMVRVHDVAATVRALASARGGSGGR